ncbi:sigma-70 family RNA polymerase sigma factor [Pedobacter africanus]|uniref:RNA polymerase sigma-70 factor, ECF subfamily n=1 Tax=Pedobacter africanus TaxID=151894 RepID=A0A1W2AGB4_9SPHI|nr:sigma-70 family RNA polymerase sigma factor [Pedobacter africanus]SMC59737.1 RNA polymerase sigma-70 factor, ECF subfamily [Pedobacter africanus]
MASVLTDITNLQSAVAKNADEAAYRKLFILFHTPVIRFANTIVHSEELAEELYADAMMKIWLMGPKLEQVIDLRVYLFTLVKNSAFNHLKKHKGRSFVGLDDLELIPQGSATPIEHLIEKELQLNLNKAVDMLPPKCQMVYRLIKNEGFSYKEVSEILSISTNTIEGHMTNALKKITLYMRQHLDL